MNKDKLLIYLVPVGAFISTALGGVDTLIRVMASMMLLDFVVGTLTAMVHGKAQSRVATKGLLKKCLSIAMVTVGVNLDKLTGQQLFRNLTVMYVICIETISLLEHMDVAEVRYPKFIRNFLDTLLGQLDKGQLPSDWKPVDGTYTDTDIVSAKVMLNSVYGSKRKSSFDDDFKEQVKEPKEPI